jgi:hypothetical protein
MPSPVEPHIDFSVNIQVKKLYTVFSLFGILAVPNLLSYRFLFILFDPEDEDTIVLRNVGNI